MHLLNPLTADKGSLSEIFEKIFNGNVVAFLGAGASVSNLKFLSQELIQYYQTKVSKDFNTDNIIKFVDILENTAGLRRSDFDAFVAERLDALIPNEGHSIFVTIPWKQVITTNYDTLIEQASENSIRDRETHLRIKAIKNKSQYDIQTGANEIAYIKLNGCKSDLAQYPFVFSSRDFKNQSSFYKKVLSPFRNFSNEIFYIAFGYSFSDGFSEALLDKLLTDDIRQRRRILCVDPYVNKDNLEYYESLGISIIKLSFEEFFINYKKWFEESHRSYLRNVQKFYNPDKSAIPLETGTRLYLDKCLMQFKEDYISAENIKKVDFYTGSEPNYRVILEGYDVVRNRECPKLLKVFEDNFENQIKTSVPKLILVRGDFGSGKTTFTLRAIKEFLQRDETTLAFEIINSLAIKKGYIAKLIREANANQFIFYCDNIETDSVFKKFNEIRVELASEQYSDKNIIFVSSIRENILQKLKMYKNFSLINSEEFYYVSTYTNEELTELVENLQEVGLVKLRDKEEKRALVYKLKNQYSGDSFISLYSLIQNGSHARLLSKAYEELTPEIQTAFKITALIHRFNMECPVSVIKASIDTMDWNTFTDLVVRGDGKTILFQEYRATTNSDPDLFFKTKHPVVAEALIKIIYRNKDKNAAYKGIFSGLTLSDYNARFIVDLIKNLRNGDEDITEGQIDKYYEICFKEFSRSIHFMLSYITHKEKKASNIKILIECLNHIEEIEAELDYRNNRLIHRKGSLNFKIATLLYFNSDAVSDVKHYLEIAEDWFLIKKSLDPTSGYSYRDYLTLLLWKLRFLKLDGEELLLLHLKISETLDEGFRLIEAEKSFLTDKFEEYRLLRKTSNSDTSYFEFLKSQYQDVDSRATACILLYYFFVDAQDSQKANAFVIELEDYLDIKEVVYFMFKYYGRNLHISSVRSKFFNLIRYNSFLMEEYPMRYFYYNSICDAYDRRWTPYNQQIQELRSYIPPTLNPDFLLYWCQESGEIQTFEGAVIVEKGLKKVQIPIFYRDFFFVKGKYKKFQKGDNINVRLHFSFGGILAEIVSE